MLDNIKYLMSLKTVDKNINEGNFELALQKLNFLIKEDYKPSITYLKRGNLCKKLLMYEDAYSDFTYIIGHCAHKKDVPPQKVQFEDLPKSLFLHLLLLRKVMIPVLYFHLHYIPNYL